jgi:hypothetical protein
MFNLLESKGWRMAYRRATKSGLESLDAHGLIETTPQGATP